MIKGLYTAASSMMATRRNLDIVSNNLANANTGGYKREEGIKESFPEMLFERIEKGERPQEIGTLGTGVRLEESYTDFKEGNLQHTNNELDLALEGDGFFVVQTSNGRRYTRNGNLTLNTQGQIVTQQGYPVLGERGEPLQTINGRDITIDENGQLYLGNLEGDQIQVVDFENKDSLRKVGDNLYEVNPEVAQTEEDIQALEEQAADTTVIQGYLEGSNVKIVEEMAKMIETTRLYQANQKVVQSIDSTLDKAVNQVGKSS